MEVMYRNNFDGYASCNTFLDDGFDSGPLFYREDPETGFYHTFQNPMWVEEKPQIMASADQGLTSSSLRAGLRHVALCAA